MATIKQRKAIDNMVENGGIASKAMLDAGYSKNTAKTPSKLTDSKGFIEIANDLGLTDSFIAQALIDDIQSKPGKRSSELALAIKVKGLEKTALDLTSGGDKIEPIVIYRPEKLDES